MTAILITAMVSPLVNCPRLLAWPKLYRRPPQNANPRRAVAIGARRL
ncbi:MAG TPA: hypothetical protein VFB80_04020 [Pirellulaceae bacterium]|nr:hypothetical protein [Pirellulaceae bacterium]